MNININNNNENEKKKIKLNIDSPKFKAKGNPINNNITFNPLNNMTNSIGNSKNVFNKFDEYDPSA